MPEGVYLPAIKHTLHMGLNITDEYDITYGDIVYSNIINGYVTVDGVCYQITNHNDTNKILKIRLFKNLTAEVVKDKDDEAK